MPQASPHDASWNGPRDRRSVGPAARLAHASARPQRRPITIASYLEGGDNLLTRLREAGMPTTATGIGREHLEVLLAALGAGSAAGGTA